MALFESKTIMWLRQFLSELGFPSSTLTIIYEDNKSAVNIIQNGNDKVRTKHMDIRYHYIRTPVQFRHISVTYLPSSQMTAGILTKPLDSKLFLVHCTSLLGNLVCEGVDLRCNSMLHKYKLSCIFNKYLILLYLYHINLIYNISMVSVLYLHIF